MRRLITAAADRLRGIGKAPDEPPWPSGRLVVVHRGFAITIPKGWITFDLTTKIEAQVKRARLLVPGLPANEVAGLHARLVQEQDEGVQMTKRRSSSTRNTPTLPRLVMSSRRSVSTFPRDRPTTCGCPSGWGRWMSHRRRRSTCSTASSPFTRAGRVRQWLGAVRAAIVRDRRVTASRYGRFSRGRPSPRSNRP